MGWKKKERNKGKREEGRGKRAKNTRRMRALSWGKGTYMAEHRTG
jgi:hypothetical protein